MAGQSKELPPWGYATAGATGAVLANALVYPLDIVKTRLQVQMKKRPAGEESAAEAHDYYDGTWHALTKILEDDGVSGLYSGMFGSLVGVASTNFAYFYWYTVVRSVYLSYAKTQPGTAAELSLGAAAGALAQLFTIPVSVITTRQQTQPKGDKKGFFDTAKEVVDSEDGWTGLWRGLKASLVLVVNPSITYGAYQRLRVLMFNDRAQLRAWESFMLGAMSKALATLATQPLIVAKVGLQSRPPPSRKGKPFKSFIEVMAYIIEDQGPTGLLKGIGPQILKGVLVQGILMMTKERMELVFILLFRAMRKVREEQAKKIADLAASKGQQVVEQVKQVAPALVK